MVTKEELKDIAILSGLNDAELDAIAPLMQKKVYLPDEILFREGDPCQGMYFVQKGVVQIRKAIAGGQSIPTNLIKKGETIESLSLADDGINHYSAIAIKPAEVLLLDVRQMEHLADKHPAHLYKLMKNLSSSVASKLNQTQTDLVDLENYMETRA